MIKQTTLNDFLFNSLFEQNIDIILVMDNQYKIVALNMAAEKYFGCTQDEALHQTYQDLCKTASQKDIFSQLKIKSQNDSASFYDKVYQIEWTLTKTLFNLTSFFLLTGRVLQNAFNDQLTQLTREKTRIETDNKTISQYLQDIISVVPGSIYWKDKNGIYLGCNDYMVQTAGLTSKSDIIGKSDFELWPKQATMFRETDQNVMKIGQAIRLEEEVLLPNGKKRLFIVGKMPLRDSDGNINGIIGNSLEITDLKETQGALEAANRAKTEFIANMSHDIRTPLAGVIGLSEALESELENPKQKEFASTIRESGNQLLNLLNGILDVISTNYLNEQDLHIEPFNLYECIEGIANLERSSTQKTGVELIVNIDKAIPPYVESDRTKFHRVLLNLLGNAIKFTKTGKIELNARLLNQDKQQATIQFEVKDTGIGIPIHFQSKVFDRFFRGNPSYQGIYKGNGIGLHLAQSYVKLLGGEIKLNSQENVGTTFYFALTFPISQQKSNKPIESIKPSSFQENTPMNNEELPHVLLVEDNAIALMVIENIVTHAHLHYTSATDGESALMLAKIYDFDLIITDLGLPGMSGIELTQEIRKWEMAHQKKPVPIIGLSAHTNQDILAECVPSGMNDKFSKPMTKDLIYMLKNTYILTPNTSDDKMELSTLSNTLEKHVTDLPETREALFELEAFPIFDAKLALCAMNNNAVLLPEILTNFLEQDLPESLLVLEEAYRLQDWDKIEKRVHYMKSTLNFTGTPRMKYACQFLERYRKAGHNTLLPQLYQQLIEVSQITQQTIRAWLKKI